MTEECKPEKVHQSVIERIVELISDELIELKELIHSPNSFIIKIVNKTLFEYQSIQTFIRRDE